MYEIKPPCLFSSEKNRTVCCCCKEGAINRILKSAEINTAGLKSQTTHSIQFELSLSFTEYAIQEKYII